MKDLLHRNDNVHRTSRPVPGGHMAAVHFGDINTPVKLVFLHATGFNALTYRCILQDLGVHVLALDLRGHGLTDLPAQANSFATFHTFAKDVIAYLEHYVPGKVIICGHSLGASAAILAQGMAPDKISKVLAFDPVVLPFFIRKMMATKFGRTFLQNKFPLARNAGRRRDTFENHEAAYKRFKGRGPFKHFPDEAVWDYVCDGFVSHNDGPKNNADGVRLTCRPKWEQFIYTAQSHNLKSSIPKLPKGSKILITNFVEPTRWIAPMAKKNTHLSIRHYPELEHFYPITHPEISIPALKDILA